MNSTTAALPYMEGVSTAAALPEMEGVGSVLESAMVTNAILGTRLATTLVGLAANLGVVLTVVLHDCPRRHAAIAAASMALANILYCMFIVGFALPLRYFESWKRSLMGSPIFCHVSQIGSNMPKTWIVLHHLWVAIDTYWLIKKPFQYAQLVSKYFQALFAGVWIVPVVFETVFQTLTLCFYETFHRPGRYRHSPPPTMAPEVTNIALSLLLYLSVFAVILSLYYSVFREALFRIRHKGRSAAAARPTLTDDAIIECDNDTLRKELRLVYGFTALIIGTVFFVIFRSAYYGVCLYVDCSVHKKRNDFLVSTLLSSVLAVILILSPYAFFYRNPLFLQCSKKALQKVMPCLKDMHMFRTAPPAGAQLLTETNNHATRGEGVTKLTTNC